MDNKNNRKKLYEYNNVLKSIDDCYRNIAKRYGFSEAAFWTLYTLRMEPGNITQSDVCTVLYQPKQTVNSALKKLESEGYITLTPAGAHTKNISLTKSGTKLCEQTVDKVIEAECAALGNMTDEESENMTALMKLTACFLKIRQQKYKDTKGEQRENEQDKTFGSLYSGTAFQVCTAVGGYDGVYIHIRCC